MSNKCPTDYEVVELIPGPPGVPGPPGKDGPEGPKGRDGRDGLPGPKGERGEQGFDGRQGPQGPDGNPGPKGCEGPKGCDGPAGPEGKEGPVGPVGPVGPPGKSVNIATNQLSDNQVQITVTNEGEPPVVTTLTAPVGPQGIQGIQGEQGLQGDQGLQGEQGLQGDQGIQGVQGIPGQDGAQGIPGQDGAKGEDGEAGPSGMVSCDFDDVTNCYNVQAVLQDGTTKDMQLGGCVTLLACGYAGDPICVTDATGTIVDADANGADIEITYTIAGATLVSMVEVDDTINSGTTSVSNFRMEGNRWCYDITTQGKVDVTNRFDIAGLPRTAGSGGPTPDGCRSPMNGSVEIEGLVTGGGQATQINKTTGGNVTQTGFNNIGGGNYDIISDTNSWVDTIIQPNVFGGDPNATQGSRHSFIVDTFGDNQQSFTVCEEFCYFEPIEYETDLSGNPIAGTGVDASGNPYSGAVFNYDGTSVNV